MMKSTMTVWPGRPYPLGATWDGEGVNFALFSQHAEQVMLCLFDAKGKQEMAQIPLRERTGAIWHGYLPDARPGLLYGYRVHGPYQPDDGHRFNAHKLLLDPYAKASSGRFNGAMPSSAIGSAAATRISVLIPATARRECPNVRWWTPPSSGATTGRRARPGMTR